MHFDFVYKPTQFRRLVVGSRGNVEAPVAKEAGTMSRDKEGIYVIKRGASSACSLLDDDEPNLSMQAQFQLLDQMKENSTIFLSVLVFTLQSANQSGEQKPSCLTL